MPDAPSPVLLFDGLCALCDRSVQFVLDHERSPSIRFASLQSDVGRTLLAQCGVDPEGLDSLVFVEGGRCHTESGAALRAAAYLTSPWRWASALTVVPRPARDAAYRWVARHRYRWFGRLAACRIPSASVRDRFLDAAPASESSGRLATAERA